jgi:hypothetical protein
MGGWQGPLYHEAVVRKGKYGGALGLCWVPCLFESETSSSTSWCGVLDRCERKAKESDVWSAVNLVTVDVVQRSVASAQSNK